MHKNVNIHQIAGPVYIGDSPEFKIKSAINELLNLLASHPYDFTNLTRKPPQATMAKIKHNNIWQKRHTIHSYTEQSYSIEEAFNQIDTAIPFAKYTILSRIRLLYLAALDSLQIDCYEDPIDIDKIRANSDYIISHIAASLQTLSINSANTPNIREHIDLGIDSIIAYAFIECIIMESTSRDP